MNKMIVTLLACTALGSVGAAAQQTAPNPNNTDPSADAYRAPQSGSGAMSTSSGGVPMATQNDVGGRAGNAAINTKMMDAQSRTTDAPVAGRNSYTEGEARSRLEKFGYANIGGLTKDGNGIWRGTATKNGTAGNVALDYQGNIVIEKP